MSTLLTGNRRGGSESSSYICVQLDIHVLLLSDLLIAFLYLLADPIGEHIAEYSGYDIAYPSPGDLVELLFIWKVFVYLVRISSAERLDLLQR